MGEIKAWSDLAKNNNWINKLKGRLELADTLANVRRIYQAQRSEGKRKLIAVMVDLAPKAAQNN